MSVNLAIAHLEALKHGLMTDRQKVALEMAIKALRRLLPDKHTEIES